MCWSHQVHPVAASPLAPPAGRAGSGGRSQSPMCIGGGVAGLPGPGPPEGAVLQGLVFLRKTALAVWRLLRCHGNQVVAAVPCILLLLFLAFVGGAGGGQRLLGQAALLLVVHEGLLVGPGHGADHLLLAAVGSAGAGVHRHGGLGVRARVRLAGWRAGRAEANILGGGRRG